MSSTRTSQTGVRDFDLKLKLSKRLLDATSIPELLDRIYGKDRQKAWDKAARNIPKWHTHYPTKRGSADFFDDLASTLDCTGRGSDVIDSTISQFIELLPVGVQPEARTFVLAKTPGSDKSAESPDSYNPPAFEGIEAIWLNYPDPAPTIAAGVTSGRIDQQVYYLTPDAADTWNRLTGSEDYPTYNQCKAALRSLTESKEWKTALDVYQPMTAVMLTGGGAPRKDLIIMRNLLSQGYAKGKALNYLLVDISVYMLKSTLRFLKEHISGIESPQRVRLSLIEDDAENLTARTISACHGPSSGPSTSSIFAITGGTIGNLSEEKFFRSLARASRPGDLLILSADTLDGIPPADLENDLRKKYDNPPMRRFLTPVIRQVLVATDSQEPVNDALNRLNFDLREAKAENFGDIPKSWSVTISVTVRRHTLTLVTSTRYDSNELLKFVRSFGWHLIHKVPSPSNSQYFQFLFVKKPQEMRGTE